MLSHFKNFINKPDNFIILVIILIALIFFGIGRLSAPQGEPIQIMNLEKASVEELSPYAPEGASEDKKTQNYEGKVVGSVNSDKYHLPDCPGAKQISKENEVWFDSIEDAKAAGYKPAANCPGLE
jgi:hypothetical protein